MILSGRRKSKKATAKQLEERIEDLARSVRAMASDLELAQRREDALHAEVARLRRRLDGQETRTTPEEERSSIRVDGSIVEIRPLGPVEWARSLDSLPSFLTRYARLSARSVSGAEVEGEGDASERREKALSEFYAQTKDWIRASVSAEDLEGLDLDRLSMPEARAAAEAVISINGFDKELEAFFRERLGRAGSRPGGAPVRSPTVGTPGDQ